MISSNFFYFYFGAKDDGDELYSEGFVHANSLWMCGHIQKNILIEFF